MHTAIRNTDGTLITNGVYDAIKMSSRIVAQALVAVELKGRNVGRAKTKQLFKQFFDVEWSEAITQLEELQPILQLCASHWKAEHVLGASLTSIQANNSRGGNSSVSVKGRKRAAEDGTHMVAKKPRQDDVTVKALRNLHSVAPAAVDEPTALSLPAPQRTAFRTSPLDSTTFLRRPAPMASETSADNSVTGLDVAKPQAVDPSYRNLISKCRYLLITL